MQTNTALLAKKAIGDALKGNWNSAIDLNLQIIEKEPRNIEAHLRLGKAYIQTKQLPKAKKSFKEVLAIDPINQVATKSIAMINTNKIETMGQTRVDTGALIKEPGTTTEATVAITARGLSAISFTSGEMLELKIKKHSADVVRTKSNKETIIGTLTEEDLLTRLNKALELNATIIATYVKGTEKDVVILIKSSYAVFKSEKQDIRPYIKKGSLDEPELEEEEIELPTE
jgi:tetratricopeptide (TPR) repeat protein